MEKENENSKEALLDAGGEMQQNETAGGVGGWRQLEFSSDNYWFVGGLG